MIHTLRLLKLSIGNCNVVDFAKRGAAMSFEQEGHVAPVAFIEATVDPEGKPVPDGVLFMLNLVFGDADQKDDMVMMIRSLASKCRAKSVTMVSEVWEVHCPKTVPTEEIEAFLNENPEGFAAHPDRAEALNIVHETNTERVVIRCQIKSDENKRYLDEWSELDASYIEGRLSNLLPINAKAFS